jgi:hypothetical protein
MTDDTYRCPEDCDWTFPKTGRNAPYFAMAHTYLYHPPDPGTDDRPDRGKRQLVEESRKNLREAGQYE